MSVRDAWAEVSVLDYTEFEPAPGSTPPPAPPIPDGSPSQGSVSMGTWIDLSPLLNLIMLAFMIAVIRILGVISRRGRRDKSR